MRVAVGADERNPVTRAILGHLRSAGHEVIEVGVAPDGAPLEWPEVGREAGEAVASGWADRAVVCCWTGTGVSIAANKVAGVRAALCADAPTAVGARRWNDANVLALGLRSTSEAVAIEMLDAFLATDPDDGERAAFERLG